MDALTFVAKLFKAGAWPIAVVALALLFRTKIEELLTRLTKGKLGPAEFEFEARLREIERESTDIRLPPVEVKDLSALQQRTESSPRAAILQAWLEVEAAIDELGKVCKTSGRSA